MEPRVLRGNGSLRGLGDRRGCAAHRSTQVVSWYLPQVFSAFCPQSGYYLNELHRHDRTGKQFLVFHGGNDTVVGQKTHDPFMAKLKAANATAELVFMPDEGHILPHAKVIPRMLDFIQEVLARL